MLKVSLLEGLHTITSIAANRLADPNLTEAVKYGIYADRGVWRTHFSTPIINSY